MKFKNFEFRIIIQVLLLAATILAFSFFILKPWFLFAALISPLIIYQVVWLIKFQRKAQEEVTQFVESVHYRDFSRYFDVKHAPLELQPLRQGFNEINSTFKIISREKETQYQYLQKILELVDTGILSFKEATGEVVWMNESLKKMLQLPYMKNIQMLAKRDLSLYEQVVSLNPGENKIAIAKLERTSFR